MTRFETDLNQLSDWELLRLEDKLLLQHELAPALLSLFSPGRLVINFLALLLFLLLLFLLHLLFIALGQQSTPLLIFIYVGCLAASVLLAQTIWESMGLYFRLVIRTVLHYWPVVVAIWMIGVLMSRWLMT